MFSARAAPPRSVTISQYIEDIVLYHCYDGVAITLTDKGLSKGRKWSGARTLARWTMFEFQLQADIVELDEEIFNSFKRQIHLEIYYHSWANYFRDSDRFRTVNVDFGRLP